MPIRTALLVAFLTSCTAPLLGYWYWSYNRAVEREIADVADQHLLIARNIADALRRHNDELIAAFDAFAPMLASGGSVGALTPLLDRVDLIRTCALDRETGALTRAGPPSPGACPATLSAEELAQIRLQTERAGGVAISGVMTDPEDGPFLKVMRRVDDQVVVGRVSTEFFREIARRNRFGVDGHVAIFDHAGRLMAHPRAAWEAEARDVAHVPPVRNALAGLEGIELFYSPAYEGEMIAGVVPVRGYGWGVMAPQPMAELETRARELADIALLAVGVGVVFSAALSLIFARWISRPIRRVARTARRMADGDVAARLPAEDEDQPMTELSDLSRSFNRMAGQIETSQAEEKRLRVEAELAAEAKSHFLANVSHEIRNPVHGLLGMAELMRQTPLDGRQERLMSGMATSGEQLTRLLDNVLDGARIETGMVELRRESVALRPLVEQAAREAAAMAGDDRIEAEFADGSPRCAEADPARLKQVLVSLAAGARRRAPDGAVRLLLEPASARPGKAMICILEPGADLPRAGAPELGAATAATLDLDISRAIVTAMNGEIGMVERPDGGVGLWLTLPVSDD